MQFQHLISHLEADDHKGIMEVLDERFGQGCLVIQDIVNQIEKMKPVTTDKGYIEFVEKVEQMKLDLQALDMLDELANHSNISKLESKLPAMISIDWGKEIMKEKLNRKPSGEKFCCSSSF